MKYRVTTPIKVIGLVVLGLIVVGISTAAMPRVKEWIKPEAKDGAAAEKNTTSVALADDDPTTIRFVIRKANDTLGVQTGLVKKASPRLLELHGSLGPDTDKLLPVRSRFPGEVMEIGQHAFPGKNQTEFRDVCNGDRVNKGDLLAVVWSKDLGLTKSNLIDSLSKLRLDQDILEKYRDLYKQGAIPERSIRDAERNVQSDQIAVRAAEMTLRSWRLTDKEIEGICDEEKRLAKDKAAGKTEEDKEPWKKWARVEVRAPFDGTILEKNLAFGAIIDTTTNLFIIGDLSHLTVWANVYEEDLPILQALREKGTTIPWKIYLKTDPEGKHPLEGIVSEIRPLIDPTQHTALVKGRVDNPEHQLVSGQFITAKVEVPPEPGTLEIPTTALIEDGQESIVFIQPLEDKPVYTLRHVQAVRRGHKVVVIRPDGPGQTKGEKPLRVGDRVVTSGALELRAALKDLQDARAADKK
jgi:cobalt-zinc-cadmium efflux system membrane fusion protein